MELSLGYSLIIISVRNGSLPKFSEFLTDEYIFYAAYDSLTVKKLDKFQGPEMLDMQRNFMISVMGGFSNYEASHMYSQHSKTKNGLSFDILNGIGSKIEKGADLETFQFRWLKIKGFNTASPISITLYSNHPK